MPPLAPPRARRRTPSPPRCAVARVRGCSPPPANPGCIIKRFSVSAAHPLVHLRKSTRAELRLLCRWHASCRLLPASRRLPGRVAARAVLSCICPQPSLPGEHPRAGQPRRSRGARSWLRAPSRATAGVRRCTCLLPVLPPLPLTPPPNQRSRQTLTIKCELQACATSTSSRSSIEHVSSRSARSCGSSGRDGRGGQSGSDRFQRGAHAAQGTRVCCTLRCRPSLPALERQVSHPNFRHKSRFTPTARPLCAVPRADAAVQSADPPAAGLQRHQRHPPAESRCVICRKTGGRCSV